MYRELTTYFFFLYGQEESHTFSKLTNGVKINLSRSISKELSEVKKKAQKLYESSGLKNIRNNFVAHLDPEWDSLNPPITLEQIVELFVKTKELYIELYKEIKQVSIIITVQNNLNQLFDLVDYRMKVDAVLLGYLKREEYEVNVYTLFNEIGS